jgi:hypothetical protein
MIFPMSAFRTYTAVKKNCPPERLMPLLGLLNNKKNNKKNIPYHFRKGMVRQF